MKTKVLLLSLVSLIGFGNAWAQQIENDDMYFNSKDRAKLRASQKTNALAYAPVKKDRKNEASEESLNPTDTYSARNVNPEYTSRAQAQTARADDEDYFVNNYQYNNGSNYNYGNNNFNNWYGNSWYQPNYWGPSISGWNSPYYGYYDNWNSPWYDPRWSYNGWSTSFSYYYGNSWNSGWGGNSYWNSPYCNTYNPYYGGAFGYGGGYWNNYRGSNIVIVNNGEAGRTISYGKRPTRGSNVVSDQSNGSRSRSSVGSGDQRGGDLPGGRVSSNRPPEYYNRSWRNTDSNSSVPGSTSYGSRSNTQSNRPSSWSNSSTPDNSSSWGSSNSSSSPSRSSFDSGGGATRTHSSSPAPASSGGGSNGRSRRD
jgi:hypothetical protein